MEFMLSCSMGPSSFGYIGLHLNSRRCPPKFGSRELKISRTLWTFVLKVEFWLYGDFGLALSCFNLVYMKRLRSWSFMLVGM